MFDRCYCINSTKYLSKFGKNMALYFVTVWQSTRGSLYFFYYPSSWSESIKRFKMAVIIRFNLDVSERTSWLLYKEWKWDEILSVKQEIGLPLYAITVLQNEPYPCLCQSAVLGRRKYAAGFLSNLFYSQFGLLKYENSIVLNLFHDMMT